MFQESHCTVGDGCLSHTDTQQSPCSHRTATVPTRLIGRFVRAFPRCATVGTGRWKAFATTSQGETTLQPEVSGCDLVGHHMTKKTRTPFEGAIWRRRSRGGDCHLLLVLCRQNPSCQLTESPFHIPSRLGACEREGAAHSSRVL